MTLKPTSSQGGGGGAISGVTVTGTAAAGDVPVASSSSAGAWALPPGYEIGYDQITSGVSIASTTEASGTTIITASAHTFDGGAVMVEFYTPVVHTSTTIPSFVVVNLFESTTQIGRLIQIEGVTTTNTVAGVMAGYRFTPSAGSHTYIISAYTNNTGGPPSIGAGTGGTGESVPAYVRFTKV